jgi:hypothetical protein
MQLLITGLRALALFKHVRFTNHICFAHTTSNTRSHAAGDQWCVQNQQKEQLTAAKMIVLADT